MNKIISQETLQQITTSLHKKKKRAVLVGGCFDVLHIGHVTFLQEAKKKGDVLLVILESDEFIKMTKGQHRPINTQIDRAKILAALTAVDYVILLNQIMKNEEYDELVQLIKPAIIATTTGDKQKHHKQRQAALVNAQVIDVTIPVSDKSTSSLINLLKTL
jgi:rfaE bifunctional protein nucleotidyltransferase chain/domain